MNKKLSLSRRDLLKYSAATLAISATGLGSFSFASNKRSAVVIGAGIAGLSTAYELKKAGFEVIVMEKWDFVGGRMRDAKMGPIYLMPHALGVLQGTKEIHNLAEEVGIANDFSGEAEADFDYLNNGVGTYAHSLRFNYDDVSKIPGLTTETIRTLPKLRDDLLSIKQKVDPSFISTGAYLDNETVGQYFNRILGQQAANQVLDYWVDPFLAAWGWTRNETTSIAVTSWMAHGQGTKTPRAGIGVLTRKLGELVPLSLSTTVRYITPPDIDGRHTVHYLTKDFERKSITPDIVVCATEGKFIPEIIQGMDDTHLKFFSSIDFSKAISVQWALMDDASPKEILGEAYTQTHPDPVKRRIAAWYLIPKGLDHPENPARLAVALRRSEVSEWQRSGLSQAEYSLRLLKQVYPEFNEAKITNTVVTGCDDLVHMPKGFVKDMSKILSEQNRVKHGLYFAGEYLAGAHTAAACASGRNTARTIINHWS
ncbi:FAD-dependent oxidoreductase [Pseudomonas sp. BGr12]|uniref:FAD-dependent oxidoreductase n=1 Tax=Pseudomonas sp. BGr12 TaxID=2936269 RepID=UPI002559BD1A|nr:FAD-dependent oxidoreductase [Pseudomonas sp. BJa5]MDL2428461.1 FAD-dependent oxidoreductase [Pseudomonas sp. BJa5]